MTIHTTKSGTIELITQWGHGRGVPVHPNRPAIIVTDDGDGHYAAWKFTGALRAAAERLAAFDADKGFSVLNGNHLTLMPWDSCPDAWIIENEDSDPVFNWAKYPNAIGVW